MDFLNLFTEFDHEMRENKPASGATSASVSRSFFRARVKRDITVMLKVCKIPAGNTTNSSVLHLLCSVFRGHHRQTAKHSRCPTDGNF